MNENRIRERIHSAVDRRCKALTPDPFLAQRVMRMAEEKGEMKVKKKLSVAMALCIVLVLLSLTALAAALLSGMEIIEQQAIPTAQGNDGEVRINDSYTYEELRAIVEMAMANGISLETEPRILLALARGEGYWEEETIMSICRVAFGGLYNEWSVEERYWYGEKMVEIGFRATNNCSLPGEGQIPADEARQLARTLLEAEYGDLPLEDPALYRFTENFDEVGWYFNYYPRTTEGKEYRIHFSHDRNVVETSCEEVLVTPYTENHLTDVINRVYGYRTYSQNYWGLEGWYAFGQLLPQAERSSGWNSEYDSYLATTYLMPCDGDLTAAEARAIVTADTGATYPAFDQTLLMSDGVHRFWKVTMYLPGKGEWDWLCHAWEIDAATGEILTRVDLTDAEAYARYIPHSVYLRFAPEPAVIMSDDDAQAAAIAALHREFGNDTLPFGDPAVFTVSIRTRGDNGRLVIFTPLTVDYARCAVLVAPDGTTKLQYGNADPLTADNLNDRMDDVYGSLLSWDQSIWVEFDQRLDGLGEPATFEGRLFVATSYPDASTVNISLDKALDIVQLDLGNVADEALSWVLIDAEPNPVWKIRMSTFPANTLYEVDAMTGEVVDREIYVCQNPDFDHDMKMFTTRRTYMPAALAEFGPVRVAMELTVKAHFDDFSWDETIFMDPARYTVTVDGMTVTFTSVDGTRPSYRCTLLEGGMDAEIEIFNVPEPAPAVEGPAGGNG